MEFKIKNQELQGFLTNCHPHDNRKREKSSRISRICDDEKYSTFKVEFPPRGTNFAKLSLNLVKFSSI